MAENDAIINMTKALARAIQIDKRYLALDKARSENDENGELQDVIGRFNLAKMNLNNELSSEHADEDRIKKFNEEMQRAYADIMATDGMAKYQAAKADVDAMITYVTAIITTAVNGGDPDAVTQPESCTGSCESCGGCH